MANRDGRPSRTPDGGKPSAGLSPAEARRQAVLKFGALAAMRESYRDQRGLPFLETVLQDTRHALRRLGKVPAFSVTAILTLALGIGASTSIFTLVHAVLLQSLPVTNPAELYRVGKGSDCCYLGGYKQDGGFSLFSYELYKYFRDNTIGFTELAAFEASGPDFGVRRTGVSSPAESFPGEFVPATILLLSPCKPMPDAPSQPLTISRTLGQSWS